MINTRGNTPKAQEEGKMKETQTKAAKLIAELEKHPKWLWVADAQLLEAIATYKAIGARFEVVDAFENENYHDIAEAIHNEIWGR